MLKVISVSSFYWINYGKKNTTHMNYGQYHTWYWPFSTKNDTDFFKLLPLSWVCPSSYLWFILLLQFAKHIKFSIIQASCKKNGSARATYPCKFLAVSWQTSKKLLLKHRQTMMPIIGGTVGVANMHNRFNSKAGNLSKRLYSKKSGG